MKVSILLTLFAFIFCNGVRSQENKGDLLLSVFKNQKEYINNNIKEKEKPKYLSLLHITNVIHPKVLDEIQKIDASFPGNGNFKIVERFDGYNSVNGTIWIDSIYYSYNYSTGKKLTVVQNSLNQLNDTAVKVIVQNFDDWSSSTFATNGQNLGGPTDRTFYLASKCTAGSAETIGFYYP